MIRDAEIASKKCTLQRVLNENGSHCEVLLQFFPFPIQMKTQNIKKTKEYKEFKERKKKIENAKKNLKRKRNE